MLLPYLTLSASMGDSSFFRLAFMPHFQCLVGPNGLRAVAGGVTGDGRGQPCAGGHLSHTSWPLATLLRGSHFLPCLHFLPSWAPSLAACLLPVVYFLLCYQEEEVGGKYPLPPDPTSFVASTLRAGNGVPRKIPLGFTPGLI